MTVEIDPEIDLIHTDMTKVKQSLLNLLSNTNKFTEEGEIVLEVKLLPWHGEKWLTFAIRDTGIGMEPEQIERLFQEFTQADASTTRRYGGTGLGLAISGRFAQMLGGTIHVRSKVDKGSVFTLQIPYKTHDAFEVVSLALEQDADDRDTDGDVVLVIDDDPNAREVLRRTLARGGFDVISAPSGEEGLDLARTMRPAVITLDVMMPNMDGWTVLTRLKQDPLTSDIPVVMVTMVSERNLAVSLGASDYLTKPVDRGRLLTLVRGLRNSEGTGSVLVVEDEPATRDILVRVLGQEGWRVFEAENGRVAMEFLETGKPSLILLDLMMPEMDGFEFLEKMRANEEWNDIPVVVVTAMELDEADRAQLKGAVERVVQKGSYTHEQLLEHVRAVAKWTPHRKIRPDEPTPVSMVRLTG